MKRGRFFLSILIILAITGTVYAVSAYNDLHLNIQTTYSNGSIQTGTFNFVFNISNTSDCANVVYSNSTNLTTDVRGIVSYYLQNISLDFSQQYWLCYYRNGVLSDTVELAKTPSSFEATNVSLSGVAINTNLNLGSYNVTNANYGFFSYLGSLLQPIANIFVGTINASGNVNVSGNITANYLFGNGQYLTSLNVGGLNVSAAGANGSIQFNNNGNLSGNANQFYINYTNGNVGIGTTSPGSPLTIGNNGLGLWSNWPGISFNSYNNGSWLYGSYVNGYMGVLSLSSTGELQYFTSPNNGTAGSPVTGLIYPFNIMANGNIGINTTTPQTPLEVDGLSSGGGGIRLQANASNGSVLDYGFISSISNLHLSSNAYWNGTNWYSITANGNLPADIFQTAGNTAAFYVGTNSSPITSANQPLSFNYIFDVLNNGNVGIGTTNPASILSVGGSGNNTGFGAGAGGIYANGSSYGIYASGSSDGVIGNSSNAAIVGYGGTYGVYGLATKGWDFYAANSTGESYFAGSVGIGTTSPSGRLDIQEATPSINPANTVSNNIDIGFINSSGWYGHGLCINGVSSPFTTECLVENSGNWYFGNLSVSNAQLNSTMFIGGQNGQVGIGTYTPLGILDINGSSSSNNNTLVIESNSSRSSGASSPRINLIDTFSTNENSAFDWVIDNLGTNFRIFTQPNITAAGTVAFFINGTNDFVGIGTTTPGYTLDVNGNEHLSGGIYGVFTENTCGCSSASGCYCACPSGYTSMGGGVNAGVSVYSLIQQSIPYNNATGWYWIGVCSTGGGGTYGGVFTASVCSSVSVQCIRGF
jgi:hypothetical protein